MEYYDLQPTFDKLYADSCNKKIFNNLYSTIICDENIKLAYRNIKRNSGSVTSGTDGITVKDIEKIPLDILHISFTPLRLRRKNMCQM